MDNFELTKFSCYPPKIYGPKLTVHTGTKHDYLGVDMEFNEDGTLDASMILYLNGVIAEFPELINGRVATPSTEHLFTVRDEKEARPLEEERALAFHHTVTQLLFMATRTRRDMRHPNGSGVLDGASKNSRRRRLGKVETYAEISERDKILKVENKRRGSGNTEMVCGRITQHPLGLQRTWRSNVTMGKGATSSYLQKVKLNTRSSTETELVVSDMYMPEMLWSLHFIEAQWYTVECVGLYQDNISTQMLIKNG